jgi:acetoin utilization deacetylase AcuC-like enzyme
MQAEKRINKVIIMDCDVHQGNGTASIFAGDDSVFTFSIHGAKNFPFHKEPSDLDVALPDGTTDEPYLEALDNGLALALASAQAELAIYLAGADPFEGDRLGRLALSKAGLAERDRRVLARCKEAGLPVAVTMSGGYAKNIDDIVDIHTSTMHIALQMFQI